MLTFHQAVISTLTKLIQLHFPFISLSSSLLSFFSTTEAQEIIMGLSGTQSHEHKPSHMLDMLMVSNRKMYKSYSAIYINIYFE